MSGSSLFSASTPRPTSLSAQVPRGHSSAGRALQWHCRGHEFDPHWLHQISEGLGLNGPGPSTFNPPSPCRRREQYAILRDRKPLQPLTPPDHLVDQPFAII